MKSVTIQHNFPIFKSFFPKKQDSLGFVGRSVLVLEFVFRVIATLFLSSAVS